MKTNRLRKVYKRPSRFYWWAQAAFSVSFLALSLLTSAQTTPLNPLYTITERGPYHRVWQRTVSITNSSTKQVTTQVEGYTELADGMHYLKSGEWAEAQDLIELTSSGAEAAHGQMKATFNSDITSAGAISLTTAGGDVFQSHPLGLFYFDSAAGKVAEIATVQFCQALLYPPNALVFSNVLTGLNADLVLVWAKNGCEQNLVLKERLPVPESFGLSSGTTHLQLWSALDRFPVPHRQRTITLKPGFVDHILDFADSWFPVGAAIEFGSGQLPTDGHAAVIRPIDPSAPGTVPVAKSIADIAGQKVLVEEVNFDDLQSLLTTLPQAAITLPSNRVVVMADRGRLLPRVPAPNRQGLPIQMASAPYSQSGVALDWQQLSGGASSYPFAAGLTYYIPISFTVSSSASFGANVTVKFASGAYFMLNEATISLPATGRRTVFTSVDDDGYGDPITGISTGNPSYAAAQEIWVYNRPTQTTIQNALFRWAQQAVHYTVESGGASQYLNSSLFQNSATGAYLDMPNTYLFLSGDTYCNVGSPTIVHAGWLSGSMPLDCRTGPGWDGIGAPSPTGVAPPDVGGAAGPSGLLEVANATMFNYVNKDGSVKQNYGYPTDFRSLIPLDQKLDQACGSVGTFWADPKAIYDSSSGRFYVIEEESCQVTGSSRCHVLVSTSNDPTTSQWKTFWFPMYEPAAVGGPPNNCLGDYPGLGMDSSALYITYNMFDYVNDWPPYFCPSPGALAYNCQVIALDKALFNAAGGQITATTRKYTTPPNNPGDQANGFSLQPATPVAGSPGNVAYFAETPQADFTHVRIWRLTNPLGANAALASATAALPNGSLGNSTLGWQNCNTGAPQPGSAKLDTVEGNRTLGNAFWYNGSVWFCTTAGGPTYGAKAYWFRVDVSNFPTLTADFGRIDPGNNIWTFYPTIGANAHGSICLVYSQSSGTQYPSICYTWRAANDTAFRAPQTLKVSGYSYISKDNPGRWGDYATVTIDPVDLSFWVAHEYARSATQDDWSTWWNNLAAP